MIPSSERAVSPPSPEPDAYQLDESHSGDHLTSFSPATGSENLDEPPPRRRAKKNALGNSKRKQTQRADSHPALSGRTIMIGLACVLTMAILTAVFMPGTDEYRARNGAVVA